MLHRADYKIILDQRGGLADDETKLGLLYTTAKGFGMCISNIKPLMAFFPGRNPEGQTYAMWEVTKAILDQNSVWASLPPIDLEIDNAPSDQALILGLAQLQKNELIVADYRADKLLTTLPLAAICEINHHMATTPGLFA